MRAFQNEAIYFATALDLHWNTPSISPILTKMQVPLALKNALTTQRGDFIISMIKKIEIAVESGTGFPQMNITS